MKDFEKQNTDSPQDATPGIVTSKRRASSSGHDASHAEAEALNLPQLSHPANAAPLADLIGQLQQTHGNTYVQRVVAEMDAAKSGAESQAGKQPQSLDAGVGAEMESAFGESFADVHVHADAAAEKMSDELGARAVTHGRDIYFGRGEYNPSTKEGKELLAHELTHVVQQRGSSISQQANTTGHVGDAFEQEADQAAASIARGYHVHVEKRGTSSPALQRQAAGGPRPQTPVAGTSVTVLLDVASVPHGTLSNGVRYTYFASSYSLDFVLPEGTTLELISRNARRLNVTDRPHGENAVMLEVMGTAGQSPEVEVRLRRGSAVVVAIFVLPPRSQPGTPPRRP